MPDSPATPDPTEAAPRRVRRPRPAVASDTGEAKSRRLTRDDWIVAATAALLRRSVDAVRVDPLATQMGVSRGSFYWHFKSRAELLEAILDTWRTRQTTRIVERLQQDASLNPVTRFLRLRSRPPHTRRSRDAAELELAIRAWARRDRAARKIVEAVDRERVGFVRQLLEAGGMTPSAAEHWALIGYAYALGESMLRETWTAQQVLGCRAVLVQHQLAAFDPAVVAQAAAADMLG